MRLYEEGVRWAAAIMSVQPPTYRGRFVFHAAANLWGKRGDHRQNALGEAAAHFALSAE